MKKKDFYRIFLVEDNPGDVRLTEEAFKESQKDIRFSIAMDGEEAIEMLHRKPPHEDFPTPDLILLDLNLPKKDGREILREIKKDPELAQIPTIILTTSNATADILDCYRLHANCFINKPVDFDTFFEVVNSIINFWLETALIPSAE